MGQGIDRNGPDSDYYISSAVTIVRCDDRDDDEMWMENLESCIFSGLGDKWSKPDKKKWIHRDGWTHREYFVLAEHEGNLSAAVVANADAVGHEELFVVVPRQQCDNLGMERLAEGMVARWSARLREALKPMSPMAATSPWTVRPLF